MNWTNWKEEIKKPSLKNNKNIFFTEYAPQNVEYSTVTPWSLDKTNKQSNKDQYIAYQALYKTFCNEDWMSGGFLWKWPYLNIIQRDA